MPELSMEEAVEKARQRREERNVRDRQARKVLQLHPEIKDDPDGIEIPDEWILEGTSENAIRSIARHYRKQAMIREILNGEKE